MKVFQSLLMLMLLSTHLLAQQFDSRIAPTRTPLENVEIAVMPALDNEALLQEELQRRGPGIAPRYAQVIDVDITPETHGNWETLSNGNAVWRLRIQSKDAKSINLGFTKFFMPQGGTLILYSTNLKKVMGPFTPADNEEHEQLWTPVFDGDELVIEVQLPESRKNELQLELTNVNHDFIGFSTVVSGSCNLDVICGSGDGWEIVEQYRDIIQSVAVIGTGGGTFCTGFLVNNARNDCTPYFMTANHCLSQGQAPSLVVYWNYINSVCRQPNSGASGGGGNGSLADFNTGSIYKANYGPSDFFLVELDDEVSETANAFFAGWSAEPDFSAVDTLIGIHHPSTDEKRISFDFDTPQRTFYFDAAVNPNADHVQVPDWDVGTTEGGSSGSPLFDDNKRVIGQLHGGGAACGNNDSDWYGSFSTSWEGGGSPQTRLRDWLDPDDTGVLELDGREQLLCNFFVLATNNNISLCAPDSAIYTINVSESFTEEVMLNIDNLPAGVNAEFSANPVMPGDMLTLTISNTAAATAGVYTMSLNAMAGIDVASSDIMLTIFTGIPDAVTLNMPVNGATGQTLNLPFSWNTMGVGVTYQFQLSTDVDFNDIVFEESGISNTNIFASMLNTQSTYFWRVIGSNICGEGDVSEVFSFETAAISCEQSSADDLPIEISSDAVNSIDSRLDINLPGFISEVSIFNLEILHTWVGDLRVTLTSPEGTTIILFDQPGVPGSNFGCGEDNVVVNLMDNAANSAADLEDSCGSDPAISGDFQPLDPFSTLIGELATGTWTLTVFDEFDQDGGQLINWDLALCIAIPNEAALFAGASEYTFCENETISFDLLTGTGFDGEISLSASGLPNDATIEFSPNPVLPGSTTSVSISGISTAGTSMLVITGDDGVGTAELPITLNATGAPAAAMMTSPANEAIDQMTGLTLTWQSVAEASSYTITIANDADFNDVIASNTQAATVFNLTGLDFGSTYYWNVESTGECGTSTDGQTFSFTTIPDVNVTISNPVQEVCLSDVAEFELQVGPGFSMPLSVTYVVSSGETVQVDYDVDENNLTPGSTITASISNFSIGDITSIDLVFTFTDGTYSTDVNATVEVLLAPALPVQTFPENGVVLFDPNINLLWDGVENTDNYFVEVSTDESFSAIIETTTVTGTSYTLTQIVDPGLYYWRITAINECGAAITSFLTFSYSTLATQELNGRKVELSPNPTAGDLTIELSSPVNERVNIQVYNISGKLLQSQYIKRGESQSTLSLDGYAAGVYLLKLTDGSAHLTRRIVLQK